MRVREAIMYTNFNFSPTNTSHFLNGTSVVLCPNPPTYNQPRLKIGTSLQFQRELNKHSDALPDIYK